MSPSPVETTVLTLLVLAAVLTAWRLLRGPSLPDRVLALDTLATIGLAFIAVQATMVGRAQLLDVGIAMGLIVALATIAFAHYLERSARPGPPEAADDR